MFRKRILEHYGHKHCKNIACLQGNTITISILPVFKYFYRIKAYALLKYAVYCFCTLTYKNDTNERIPINDFEETSGYIGKTIYISFTNIMKYKLRTPDLLDHDQLTDGLASNPCAIHLMEEKIKEDPKIFSLWDKLAANKRRTFISS